MTEFFPFSSTNNKGPTYLHWQLQVQKHFTIDQNTQNELTFLRRKV